MAETAEKLPENYTLSVVVPVYNEEENVTPLAEELIPVLEKTKREFEVIFVNDASTDGSLDALRCIKKEFDTIRVLSFEENCGQTSAFDAGFNAAKGDVIITMDGDMQNDPHDIPGLLEKINNHHMVVGWRWNRRDTFVRRISSRIANAVRRMGLDDPYRDTSCSLKAFRRNAMLKLNLFNYMHRFFPVLFNIEGFSVVEVKVNHRERKHGKTKYGIRNRMHCSWRAMKYVRYMKGHKLKYKIKEEF